MKRLILTSIVALSCLCASAQFTIMTNINEPAENENWGMENFTNDIGIGYQINDEIMLGVKKNGDQYDYYGRYNISNNLYLSAQMPQENSTDNMTWGLGFSISVWDNLYIEPNYTRKDEQEGFNLGLSYKL